MEGTELRLYSQRMIVLIGNDNGGFFFCLYSEIESVVFSYEHISVFYLYKSPLVVLEFIN